MKQRYRPKKQLKNQNWRYAVLAGLLTYSLGCSTTHKVDASKPLPQDPSNVALDDLVQKSRKSGNIQQIKVIAWADQAYPESGSSENSERQIRIADQRNEEIKEYFDENYPDFDVDVYNMAKKPNALQELFETSDARMKNTLNRSGALLARRPQSRALILSVLK